MIFYPWFAGDYAKKTQHLSLVEHGVYNVLLDAYYGSEKPLPYNLATLQRMCRAMSREEKVAVELIIAEYFYIGKDNLFHNEKADEVIAKQLHRIEVARANGRRNCKKQIAPVTDIDVEVF